MPSLIYFSVTARYDIVNVLVNVVDWLFEPVTGR